MKSIIYYTKYNTNNLIICSKSSTRTDVLHKTNIIYQSKCPLRECISDRKRNIYDGYTTTTLTRRLTLHMSNHIPVHSHNIKKKYLLKTQLSYTKKISN